MDTTDGNGRGVSRAVLVLFVRIFAAEEGEELRG
jgi:hypothetical protein